MPAVREPLVLLGAVATHLRRGSTEVALMQWQVIALVPVQVVYPRALFVPSAVGEPYHKKLQKRDTLHVDARS